MTSLTAFSTADLPVGDRVAEWERHNAAQLIGLRCTTLDGARLDATEITRTMPSVQLGRVEGSAHVVERTSSAVSANPADAVVIYLVLAGSGFFHHTGGAFLVDPGHLVVADADKPFMRGFSSGLTELVVKVPRTVARDLTGRDDVGGPTVLEFGTGPSADLRGGALARAVTRSLVDDGAPSESEILDLVRSVLDGNRRADTAVWAEIEVVVARSAHDPLLSASDIAAAVGVSTRQVSRLFAAHDTSVSAYVLRRRLDRAHRLLSQVDGRRPAITDVAAECGFSSPAYFSRTFRTAFGVTPTEVRDAGR
ncbi:helix-turn-helix domain-containing protein [Williamsia phyllosphaerae]|uniref:AraC family transcriptional regulator n=1 Tax=Williamsia phyllosphaerae TaxID=885042 RepID=A0ABQ1UMM7_9NOCA|nr:AraC family transcriptional regulator [Williamsia phyllosphaerae]GGF20634.1 AraC family transcriptional regulator [Williamsia phyllosphaerae]